MKPARILIADDHEVFRRGLRSVLADVPAWQVIAEAGDGAEAVQLAATLAPDIVVIDLSMPRLNGLDAARQIRSSLPTTQVLIVTAHESEQLIREVLDAGALGYLLKSDAGALLVKAVESLLEGRPWFTSKVGHLVLEGYLRTRRDGAEVEPLSPRERHIVQLLAEGRSNKEVARALHISVKTVETHRSNIMRKMGFTSLADLVRYAVRNKIVEA
jgi:DNA-binding NarL/FixJ family response regulator